MAKFVDQKACIFQGVIALGWVKLRARQARIYDVNGACHRLFVSFFVAGAAPQQVTPKIISTNNCDHGPAHSKFFLGIVCGLLRHWLLRAKTLRYRPLTCVSSQILEDWVGLDARCVLRLLMSRKYPCNQPPYLGPTAPLFKGYLACIPLFADLLSQQHSQKRINDQQHGRQQ